MKLVKENWEFKIEMVNGEMICSAHYTVNTEYGDLPPRGMNIEFSTQEETQIKNFIMNVVRPKVEANESGN